MMRKSRMTKTTTRWVSGVMLQRRKVWSALHLCLLRSGTFAMASAPGRKKTTTKQQQPSQVTAVQPTAGAQMGAEGCEQKLVCSSQNQKSKWFDTAIAGPAQHVCQNAPSSPPPYLRGMLIGTRMGFHIFFAEGTVAIALAEGRRWIPSRRKPECVGALQSGLRYWLSRERLSYLLGAVSRIHAGLSNASSASPTWRCAGEAFKEGQERIRRLLF